MKRGMTKADEKVIKVTGGKLAKMLLRVVGLGLAAGVTLIAVTDKTMKKIFPQDEQGNAGESRDAQDSQDAQDAGKAGECGAAEDEHVSRDFIRWEDEK